MMYLGLAVVLITVVINYSMSRDICKTAGIAVPYGKVKTYYEKPIPVFGNIEEEVETVEQLGNQQFKMKTRF